ncbi:hypothetical protein ABIB17_000876 [Arthrobacter sp. UYEF6]
MGLWLGSYKLGASKPLRCRQLITTARQAEGSGRSRIALGPAAAVRRKHAPRNTHDPRGKRMARHSSRDRIPR